MKQLVAILIITLVVTIGGVFLQVKMDDDIWNNGKCNCGTEWTFSNADHIKNDTLYYYHCDNCGNVIELHSNY